MKVHFLKTWHATFQKSWDGDKPWEVRLNDRAFRAGDQIVLLEYDPTHDRFSGRWLAGLIPFLIEECFGIKDNHVVLTAHFFGNGTSLDELPDELKAARASETAEARA